MSKLKWVKWEAEDEKAYNDILLEARDYKAISSFLSGNEIFDKLHKISEYRLAMELSKGKINIDEFKWAMAYWDYLKKYFNKAWQED